MFRKGSIVYGLDRARSAVAKEERALVVEGYTDVLALHQAGLHSVVASMGTALTEPQLKELRRLARHLYLCFDADAAGEAATLRGMELAVKAGFDVRVVPLPPGLDPADAAEGFEERLAGSVGYLRHRVDTELATHPKQEAFEHVREARRRRAARPGAGRGRPGTRPTGSACRSGSPPGARRSCGQVSPKLLDAGARLERRLLAACTTSPGPRRPLPPTARRPALRQRPPPPAPGPPRRRGRGRRRPRRRGRGAARDRRGRPARGGVRARALLPPGGAARPAGARRGGQGRRHEARDRAPAAAAEDPRGDRRGRHGASLDFSGRAIPGSSIGRASGC